MQREALLAAFDRARSPTRRPSRDVPLLRSGRLALIARRIACTARAGRRIPFAASTP
jgi:hypothetical protein